MCGCVCVSVGVNHVKTPLSNTPTHTPHPTPHTPTPPHPTPHTPSDYPLLLIEEFMNNGDLLGVLKDSRPSMSLPTQLDFAFQVADGMRYLADDL